MDCIIEMGQDSVMDGLNFRHGAVHTDMYTSGCAMNIHLAPPMCRPRRWLCVLSAVATALAFSPPATATLGEGVSSVEANRVKMLANLRVVRKTNYAVHELGLPTGGKVRQFVADSGKVFAVCWSAGWRPDLREIMGTHYDRYVAATKGRIMVRGPVRLELPGLVVILGGHQRAFFGRVYLLGQLPPNMRVEDIH
jgi:hypothetical protein